MCNSHKCKAPYHIQYIIYMRLNSSKPQNKSLKNQKVRKLGTNFSGVVCQFFQLNSNSWLLCTMQHNPYDIL